MKLACDGCVVLDVALSDQSAAYSGCATTRSVELVSTRCFDIFFA